MSKFKIVLRLFAALIISCGLLSLPFLVLGIEFECTGPEVFPIFYASPFIYKSTSTATSLAYDYYILGLILNCSVWMSLILLSGYGIRKFINKMDYKMLRIIHKLILSILVFVSILSVTFTLSTSAGSSTDWKAKLDVRAEEWGMNCNGQIKILN